jgi:pimeloyl-ACP methyl ester carboxylesterase
MIAQELAVHWPERVRTLTSIMASPSPRIGQAKIPLAIKIAKLLSKPVHSGQEAGQQVVETFRLIGTPPQNYPTDEAWLREIGAKSYERAYDPAGKLRQQAALLASGNRTKSLRHITAPTLVMHGDADPLFRLKGGIATAKAIPGAKLVVLKGIGHGAFPRQIWPTMIDSICSLVSSTEQ